jgi:hypothetical protein
MGRAERDQGIRRTQPMMGAGCWPKNAANHGGIASLKHFGKLFPRKEARDSWKFR